MRNGRLWIKAIVLAMFLGGGCACLAQGTDQLRDARAALMAQDYAKGLQLLRPLAEQGNARAQHWLASMYANGSGVDRNHEEAARWFLKAAEQGEVGAQSAIAALYADGAGVKQDYAEAAKWFRKAAEQGNASAQAALGTLYGRGDGVPQDSAEAMRWYLEASEQGYADAQWRLASMYLRGEGVPIGYAEAERWFRKAASQGSAAGYFGLGHLYVNGLGVSRDVNEAAKWFKLASDGANSLQPGQFKLSKIFFQDALWERALRAPAADLASSYMGMKGLLADVSIAERGGTVQLTSGETIRADNAGRAKLEVQSRLSRYGAAMVARGYPALAGRYSATATPSCERSGSLWAGSIRAGIVRELNILQDSFELTVVQSAELTSKPVALEVPGASTESVVIFVDPANSDFILSGTIANGEIVVGAHDVDRLLAAWPRWARPPNRSDLAECRVTLVPIQR